MLLLLLPHTRRLTDEKRHPWPTNELAVQKRAASCWNFYKQGCILQLADPAAAAAAGPSGAGGGGCAAATAATAGEWRCSVWACWVGKRYGTVLARDSFLACTVCVPSFTTHLPCRIDLTCRAVLALLLFLLLVPPQGPQMKQVALVFSPSGCCPPLACPFPSKG